MKIGDRVEFYRPPRSYIWNGIRGIVKDVTPTHIIHITYTYLPPSFIRASEGANYKLRDPDSLTNTMRFVESSLIRLDLQYILEI